MAVWKGVWCCLVLGKLGYLSDYVCVNLKLVGCLYLLGDYLRVRCKLGEDWFGMG